MLLGPPFNVTDLSIQTSKNLLAKCIISFAPPSSSARCKEDTDHCRSCFGEDISVGEPNSLWCSGCIGQLVAVAACLWDDPSLDNSINRMLIRQCNMPQCFHCDCSDLHHCLVSMCCLWQHILEIRTPQNVMHFQCQVSTQNFDPIGSAFVTTVLRHSVTFKLWAITVAAES